MTGLGGTVGRVARRVRREIRWRTGPSRDLSGLRIADIGREALAVDAAAYAGGRLHEAAGFDLGQLTLPVPPRVIVPGYRYDLPAPTLLGPAAFTAHLRDWFATVERKFQAGGVPALDAVIDDAVLFRGGVFVRRGDTLHAVYEACRDDDRAVLRAPTRHELRRALPIDEPVAPIFLSSVGSDNYGHFLTDDATRLVAMADAAGEALLLMTDAGPLMNERRRELVSLVLRDRPHRLRFVETGRPVHVPRLRYPSRPTHHPFLKSPEALVRLRDSIAPVGARIGGGLYISRRTPHGRRLTDEAGVEALLRERGFRVLDPLAADAREQAMACAGADIVVGVMGAAMTNTLFCRPGSRVIHLAPEGWEEPYYWDLAAACGHRHVAIYGPTTGTEPLLSRAFSIAPADLAAALDGPNARR